MQQQICLELLKFSLILLDQKLKNKLITKKKSKQLKHTKSKKNTPKSNLKISNKKDIDRIENIWSLKKISYKCPKPEQFR